MLIATDYARKMALDMRMIDPTCEDVYKRQSVAKEIAHIVGADKREEGYMQGNGYYAVSYTHLQDGLVHRN